MSARGRRLHRAADPAAFRAALLDLTSDLTPFTARDTFVVVPTRAAAEQLRRTMEDARLTSSGAALVVPPIGTRADLYAALATRLLPAPRMLTPFEREVILGAAARVAVEAGHAPPFTVRPGLVAEMLALYDLVRRNARTIDDFDRNLVSELQDAAESDRGAARLLAQTRFLTAAFREYEARRAAAGACDEHACRERLVAEAAPHPLARLVVTVADAIADANGLWPADLLLVSRLPGLASLEIVATEATLGAGFLERVHAALPELEEITVDRAAAPLPVLRTPGTASAASPSVAEYRDREDELAGVARRLKRARRDGDASALHRTALVVARPLPYLYLARDAFDGAGIPFEALDTLPLAAEPYAAAVDLALEAVVADYSRASLVALLRSPHFRITDDSGVDLDPAALQALDAALAEARYLGGLDRLEDLLARWRGIAAPASRDERRRVRALPALTAAVTAARALAPLASEAPVSAHIETLLAWLSRFDRPAAADDPNRSRRRRVQAAVRGALGALAEAYRRHDPDATADIGRVTAAARRWLESQTFALHTGAPGLQIVDADAAPYGAFDDVQIVGLVDGEWPERPRRSVFYPASLLAALAPAPVDPRARERDALNARRAAFRDLLRLPAREIRLSTIQLEDDAVVEPTTLVDEIPAAGLPTLPDPPVAGVRVFRSEAVSTPPAAPDALAPEAAAWARLRLAPREGPPDRFRGQAGDWSMRRISVSRLERYLNCPFRFFASEVLRLEEEPEDEDTRTPLERGRFLHELFERFFSEWQRGGRQQITPDTLPEARELFEAVCEQALSRLSAAEAAIERPRLLGSAVSPGIGHRVLAMEAERSAASEVVARLIEYPIEGVFTFHRADGTPRDVELNAKADRIDLLANGSLRVIDYKSNRTPNLKSALQLPVYSLSARDQLSRRDGRAWTIAEAMYVSFEGDRAVVPFAERGKTLAELLDAAEDRLIATLDHIAAGRFPPRPERRSLCASCPYDAVCRKEWVDEAPADE
ncbi:MAG: PD-(D/E)XK nuclease family protein [Acidobacteriota bacterium]